MSTPRDRGATADGWTIVVPVKALGHAKSRMARALDPAARRALVLAMAVDVLTTCTATPGVSRVRVVTSDPEVATSARELGVEVIPEPAPDGPGDQLNAALAAALDDVRGRVGVVTADLPELRPDHLGSVLDAAGRHQHSTVPDHRGVGTTMAFWSTGDARVPRFGAASAARYLSEGGAVPLTDVDESGAVGRDVDTPGDLDALTARPVGAATATALRARLRPLTVPADGVSATMVP